MYFVRTSERIKYGGFDMTDVTATELQTRTGAVIERALIEPVRVTRNKRPVVVLLSAREFDRLTSLEDDYWGRMADDAARSGSATDGEVKKLLEKLK
jgi:prevent-host-death family protein